MKDSVIVDDEFTTNLMVPMRKLPVGALRQFRDCAFEKMPMLFEQYFGLPSLAFRYV